MNCISLCVSKEFISIAFIEQTILMLFCDSVDQYQLLFFDLTVRYFLVSFNIACVVKDQEIHFTNVSVFWFEGHIFIFLLLNVNAYV